ncbi:helix-turn-helix domain-containing protein [Priestia megaterium]|uniref:helix-turn-helix domain-containing protein n=1 Tax=Priestia megaterium TaxID=1404 RepID=UPI00387A0C83
MFQRRVFVMDYEKVYSLTAIADKLGRSRSSVYDWLHTYKEFVEPHTVGKGRTKKYKESIFPVLSLIEDLKAEGHPNDYIRALLASEGHDIVVEGETNENAPVLTQLTEAYKTILTKVETLESQNEDLARQNEKMANAMQAMAEVIRQTAATNEEKEAEREKRQLERDQMLIDTMRQLHADKQQEAKGFFSKLFGK